MLHSPVCNGFLNGQRRVIPHDIIQQAKAMEKEQMISFAEYVARYPDKNRNYLGQMLHARSKYDEANRTVDLLEQYYNETYGTKETLA
jgi:hypothetical protein